MWILESDGDALKGKKLWLRPGKRFIFGRTKSEGGQVVIVNKTISRQHLIVEVGTAGAADCHNAQSRSTLTLIDCETKIGTLVNGEQIRGKSYVVSSGNNDVTLGKYEHHFTFTWIPINLTFSFTSKEARADPYSALYEYLGPLDIKVLTEYKRGVTTHLVAKKRNTSKGLQALIDGRYIVHFDSYINALVAACTPPSDGSKSQSLLEEDWEGNFPDPLAYLPPRGEEPTQRDATAYSPNPARQNMFEGYTFVFYEKRQFENLLVPITEGQGKALLQEAIPNETTVDEFVRYVKSVAGEKGLGVFEDGSEGKGVVVVRFNPVKGVGSDWFADFNRDVSLYLDHRLVEQNEFLDAILGNDGSVLRRPLEFAKSSNFSAPPSAATAMSSQILRSSPQPQPQPSSPPPTVIAPLEPARRGRSRRNVTKRFMGFDDEFGGAALGSVPESMAVDSTPAVESQSQGLFVSQGPSQTNWDREESQVLDTQRGGRKRSTPPLDYDDGQDMMENVAPAAQAYKRRKLADEAARRRRGEFTPPAPVVIAKSADKKTKAVKKEIDVQEVLAKKQAEDAKKAAKAEDLARAEREALQETLDGMSIDDIRNLATIEEMEVCRSAPPLRSAAQADESDRWEERWNGRKNFKKFRRRGVDPSERRFTSRVIVQLEEVKKKDFGVGDEYWLESNTYTSEQRSKKRGKGRDTQDSQARPHSQTSTPKSRHTGAPTRDVELVPSETEASLDDEDDTCVVASSDIEIIGPHQPKLTARSSRVSKLANKTNQSQNLPARSGSGNKRAATASLGKPDPAKRVKPAPVAREASDDDSDDGLKFRFARRK